MRFPGVALLSSLALVACATGGESVHEDEPEGEAGAAGAAGATSGGSGGGAGQPAAGSGGKSGGSSSTGGAGSSGSPAAGGGGGVSAGGAGAASGAAGSGGAGAAGAPSGGAGSGGAAAGKAGASGAGSAGASGTSHTCPTGMLVSGLRADGTVVCGSVTAAIRGYVNASCSVFLGWRDSCDGCASPPAKWGKVSADACANGVGTDDVCITAQAPDASVRLFGLNPDGDVDGNDMLFVGFTCDKPPATTTVGCAAGTFASGFDGANSPICVDPSAAAIATVNADCQLYGGWRDSCDGCSTAPPAKWDRTQPGACENLAGATGDTCGTHTLGGDSVNLLGVDFDGDVDGNDTIYVGFRCEGATTIDTTGAVDACPQGMFATGTDSGGKLACAPVSLAFAPTVRSSCRIYAGWQDNCGGCANPPAKWGKVTAETCEVGQGTDCTCATQTLGADTVPLFGLNFDGDVGNDDLLSLGFHCY